MKTSKEVLAINKFLEHLRNGLKEIGYNIGFVYNNDKEEVRISGMRAVDIVNVYANWRTYDRVDEKAYDFTTRSQSQSLRQVDEWQRRLRNGR